MIQYKLTKKEVVITSLRRSFIRRECIMIYALAVAFTFVLYFTDFGPRWASVLPIAICVLLPFIQVYWVMRLIKSNPAILSETTIEFDENSLSIKNDIASSSLPLKSFIKAAMHKEYFELYITEMQAYVIPKRAFDSNQLEKFENIVSKIQQSHTEH